MEYTNYKIGRNNKGNLVLWKVQEPRKIEYDNFTYKFLTIHYKIGVLGKSERTIKKNLEKYRADIPIIVDEFYNNKRKTFYDYSEMFSTLEDTQFTFGKLKGQDITTSDNVWYLETQSTKTDEPQSEVAKQRLLQLGNHLEHNGRVLNKNIVEALSNGYIRIIPTKNIHVNYSGVEDYWLNTEEYGKIKIEGVKLKTMSYNGFSYFLPVDENGVGKKIKGKGLIMRLDNKLTDENKLICKSLKIVSKKEINMELIMKIL